MACQTNIQPTVKSSCRHIAHLKIIIIFNGKITERTPIETSVTGCACITWFLPNLFFKRFDPIIKQNVYFLFFLDFLGWAVGDFISLDFLYFSVYVFGKFSLWNFQVYHHLKFQFSFFFTFFSRLRCWGFPVTSCLASLLHLIFWQSKFLLDFTFPLMCFFISWVHTTLINWIWKCKVLLFWHYNKSGLCNPLGY